MQPEERDAAYIWDMIEAAKEVTGMIGDLSLTAFLGNLVLMRAVERNVEIIGEAAGRVSQPYREAHPEIPSRQIIGQRHILIRPEPVSPFSSQLLSQKSAV